MVIARRKGARTENTKLTTISQTAKFIFAIQQFSDSAIAPVTTNPAFASDLDKFTPHNC